MVQKRKIEKIKKIKKLSQAKHKKIIEVCQELRIFLDVIHNLNKNFDINNEALKNFSQQLFETELKSHNELSNN